MRLFLMQASGLRKSAEEENETVPHAGQEYRGRKLNYYSCRPGVQRKKMKLFLMQARRTEEEN